MFYFHRLETLTHSHTHTVHTEKSFPRGFKELKLLKQFFWKECSVSELSTATRIKDVDLHRKEGIACDLFIDDDVMTTEIVCVCVLTLAATT